MAQSPLEAVSPTTISDYLKNWDALSSMIVRGRSFSGGERNCVFLNPGTTQVGQVGRFADVSAASGLDLIDDGRATASCDWDGDGDLDLWFTNRSAPRLRFLKNNLPGTKASGSVSLRLEGKTCNRDAIGAVVKLEIGGRKLTRAVTAGDGFMSQSSKHLHFGLAGAADGGGGSATVNWPGGTAESFPGIQRGGRYRLVQGSGVAEPLKPATPPALPAGAIEPAAPTEAARIILTERQPAPPIDYVDFGGKLQRIGSDSAAGSAVLINLWASWCAPCVAELADFTAHSEQLRAKGLKIVALTTEAVSPDGSKPDISQALELAKKSAYPFQIGATDANGLRLLTVLHNQNFVRERPLPLPSSFLIDKHGRLAAIYKGPVEAEQLLADLDLLESAPGPIEEAAFPFPSRDGLELFHIGGLDFAKAYLDAGYLDDARLAAHKAIDAADAAADTVGRARAWYFLGTLEQGARQWAAAAQAYKKSIEFAPGQPLLQVALGVVLWQAGEHEAADGAFSTAAQSDPGDLTLMDALGKAHLQLQRNAEAVGYFEKALALKPDAETVSLSLALAHEKAGTPDKALAQYRAVLKSHPDSPQAKNNLAWFLATTPDASLRDSAESLTLANEINQATQFGSPMMLNTLAAAQAEAGDFTAATATADKAITIARATGRLEMVAKLRQRRDSYRSGNPTRSGNEN